MAGRGQQGRQERRGRQGRQLSGTRGSKAGDSRRRREDGLGMEGCERTEQEGGEEPALRVG
jgi:hypothetical protein